ncbi:MAG: DUF2530 domain-containing protein [Nocardioidaceae bacterium]
MTDEPRESAPAHEQVSLRPGVEKVDIGYKSYLVAQVEPLDVTGVRTIAIGTLVWLIGFVALLPFYGTLRHDGHAWWMWTCLAGFGLGLIGIGYCRRRQRKIARRAEHRREDSSLPASGP